MYDTSKESGKHPKFTTLTYKEYKLLDADSLLETLRKSHLVLTECPFVAREFDRAGLVRLGALGKKISVHGL
jgi:hypothetical protein